MNSGASAALANTVITISININKKQIQDENKKRKISQENTSDAEQKRVRIETPPLLQENVIAINDEQCPIINNKDNCCSSCIIL